jgi:hypothetical protein
MSGIPGQDAGVLNFEAITQVDAVPVYGRLIQMAMLFYSGLTGMPNMSNVNLPALAGDATYACVFMSFIGRRELDMFLSRDLTASCCAWLASSCCC